MKRHLLPVALLMIMLAGCADWVTPKRVAVSSDATFKVPVGDIPIDQLLADSEDGDFSLADILSPEGMLSQIDPDGTAGIGVYEYTADKKDGNDEGLTYLMHYHLLDFSQDVGSLLNDFDFSSGLDSAGSSGTSGSGSGFSLNLGDDYNFGCNESADIFDVSTMKESFLDQLNSDMSAAGFQVTIPETGASDYQYVTEGFASNIINIEVDHAEGITYSQGSEILVDVERAVYNYMNYGFSIQIKAYITDWDDNIISGSETDWVEMNYGGRLRIPFAGEKPSAIKVVVEGRTKGGTISEDENDWHKYDIQLSLSNFGIDKVSGITATAADLGITIPPVHVTKTLDDVAPIFSDLKIKKGLVTIKANKPDGWENVVCSVPVSFWGTGIPESAPMSFEDAADKDNYLVSKEKDLSGLTIFTVPGEDTLVFDGSVDLSFENATIDFTKLSETPKITATVIFLIDEIEEVTVNGSLFMDDVSVFKQEAPSVFGDMIKSIDFNEVIHGSPDREGNGYGFKLKVNNTLPEGNNIPFRFVSEFLNYDSARCIDSNGNVIPAFPVNKDGKSTDVTLTNFGTVTFERPAEGETKYIDLSMSLPDTFKLYNIEIGKPYSVGIEAIEPIFDWDKAVIDYDQPLAASTIDLSGYNIAELLESFNLDSIGLPAIDAYVFVSKSDPNFMSGTSISGRIDLTYKDSENNPVIKPIFKEGDTGHICVPGEIEWPEMGKPFAKSLDSDSLHPLYLAKIPFGSVLADDPTDLNLDFEIGLKDSGNTGAITINRSSLEDSDSQTISVDIAIKVPFSFTINEPLTFDLMEMSDPEYYNKMDEDLLQRNNSSGDNNDGNNGSMFGGDGDDDGFTLEISDVLSRIDYFTLNLTLKNKLLIVKNGSGDDVPIMKLTIKDENIRDAEGNPFTKEITVNTNGKTEFKFEGEDLNRILNSEVFHPSIILTIGGENTEIGINDAVFNVNPDSNESLLSVNMLFELKLNGDNPIVLDLSSGEGNGGM